jgi:hypothetical protein
VFNHPTGKGGNKDIYVIGCGQSLEGFSWPLLASKTTIAVNGALQDVPNPDFFITADSRIANMYPKANFYNTSAFRVLVMGRDHTRWQFVHRNISCWHKHIIPARFDGQIGFSEDAFATGQCSGFCGMQLAVLLGAECIHLLGFDFCGTGGGNYHGRYSSNALRWNEFLVYFNIAIGILCQHNIAVISHSPISKLNDTIPYAPLEESIS